MGLILMPILAFLLIWASNQVRAIDSIERLEDKRICKDCLAKGWLSWASNKPKDLVSIIKDCKICKGLLIT